MGRFFVAHALSTGRTVVGIGRSKRCDDWFTHHDDAAPAPVPTNIRLLFTSDTYAYHSVDLVRSEKLAHIVRDVKPRAIVHFAGSLRGDQFEHLVRNNIIGTAALFDAIERSNVDVECVVFVSSASVYGAARRLPISEEDPCNPADLYAVTKFAGERIASIRATDTSSRVICARVFSVVGPGQDERHVCGRFAAQAVRLAARRGDGVLRVGDLRSTRDFIDVRDTAEALLLLVEHGRAGEAYNICSGIETPIDDVLRISLNSAGLLQRPPLEKAYERAIDFARNVGSNAKLRSLGWTASVSLSQSISDLVTYYRSAM
jgi:GDP-4-dehydro-6-deoxy-D-mannose reductase